MFNKLSLTDDDYIATVDEGIVRSMGTIAIKICRVAVRGPAIRDPSTYAATPSSAVLHERSKKAVLSHQTGFGAAIVVPATGSIEVTWIETYENPLMICEIAYRSRTLLELNDIIPGIVCDSLFPLGSLANPPLFCSLRDRSTCRRSRRRRSSRRWPLEW